MSYTVPHPNSIVMFGYIPIGTAALIADYPDIASDELHVDGEAVCQKDIERSLRLRKWSRGHQFIVRGGGHIDTWVPLLLLLLLLLLYITHTNKGAVKVQIFNAAT